jgi:hypothetical protein
MSIGHKKRIAWTDEMLHLEALKYSTRDEFECITRIEQFLGITGFMSESEQKAA